MQKFFQVTFDAKSTHNCGNFPNVRLGDVCSFRCSNGNLNKSHFATQGLPYIQYGQIHKGEFTTATNCVITYIDPIHCDKVEKAQPGEVIITDVSEDVEGVGKAIAWIGDTGVVTSQNCLLATPDKQKLDGIYLAYFLKSYNFLEQKRRFTYGSSIFKIYAKDIPKCTIPLPPLEVQQAIGKFLYQLEEVFANKQHGLTCELELRKRQIKFYFDELKCLFPRWHHNINHTGWKQLQQINLKDIKYIHLGELANLKLGRAFNVKQLDSCPNAIYPLYSAATDNFGEVAKLDTYDYDGEYITWTTRGANTGEVFYRNEKFSITSLAGIIENTATDIVSTKYLYTILKVISKSYVNQGGGMPMLNLNVIEQIKIPIIPLKIQEQIGDFIFYLEKLINSPNNSIETEIKLREKQLKFYIDKFFNNAA